MRLVVFEDLLDDVKKEMHKLEFDELLRKCRETLGLQSYRVAEFMGIGSSRLRLLERATFAIAPSRHELDMLEKIFGIPTDVWRVKAEKCINERIKTKKIRRRYAGE